jgi:exopolysaccharide production protein ExoQ
VKSNDSTRAGLETAAILFMLLASIRRILMSGYIYLEGDTFEKVYPEMFLWLISMLVLLWLRKQENPYPVFLNTLKRNWPVLLFIGFSWLSLIWSVNTLVTFYKVFILTISSVAAIYVGEYLGLQKFLNILAWFCGGIAILSFMLAVFAPELGIHTKDLYLNSWHGIFWTRGRLGSFMAFGSLVMLIRMASANKKTVIVYAALYLLAVSLVFLSRSATSVIVLVLVHILFLICVAWRKWNKHLTSRHYVLIGSTGIISILLIVANLDFFFGLLGRESSLTGRIPMWNYLIQNVFKERPILGYGFGALWEHDNFRVQMQGAVGWLYPVAAADNGFLDVLLNLGVVGLALFLTVISLACFRTVRYARDQKSILGFFPLLLVVSILVTNLTLSYFFEFEFFTWFLLAVVLFIDPGRAPVRATS